MTFDCRYHWFVNVFIFVPEFGTFNMNDTHIWMSSACTSTSTSSLWSFADTSMVKNGGTRMNPARPTPASLKVSN